MLNRPCLGFLVHCISICEPTEGNMMQNPPRKTTCQTCTGSTSPARDVERKFDKLAFQDVRLSNMERSASAMADMEPTFDC